MNFNKVIDIEDFDCDALKPYLERISALQMRRLGIENAFVLPDSKNWEDAMALYAFDKLNLNVKGKVLAVIGNVSATLAEILSSSGAVVFLVDRYFTDNRGEVNSFAGFMVNRSNYFHESAKTKNIIPVHSDPRELELPSSFFDAVYLSKFGAEYFKGIDGFKATVAEISRILKPGGYVSIAADFILDGPEYTSSFDNQFLFFNSELLNKHIIEPFGLISVDALKKSQSPKTYKTRKNVVDFLDCSEQLEISLPPQSYLAEYFKGFLFCSSHILLNKPMDWKISPTAISLVDSFRKQICVYNQLCIRNITDSSREFINRPVNLFTGKNLNLFVRLLFSINNYLLNFPKTRLFLLFCLKRLPFIYPYLKRTVSDKKVDGNLVNFFLRSVYCKIKSSPRLFSMTIKCLSVFPGVLPRLRRAMKKGMS